MQTPARPSHLLALFLLAVPFACWPAAGRCGERPAPAARDAAPPRAGTPGSERRLLYVAVPGVRDYLEYGGHGLLVGAEVQSEKMLEIDFQGDRPVRAGNQFGVGMVLKAP